MLFNDFNVFQIPFVGDCRQVQGCHLRPGEYLSHANWAQIHYDGILKPG
jgi:hypothetical protein